MKHNDSPFFIQAKNTPFGLLFVLLLAGLAGAAGQGRPEIIDYYWNHAAGSWTVNRTTLLGQSYSCQVWAVLQELTRGGRVKSADTSVNRYFFSGERIDSVVHQSGDEHLTIDVDLTLQDIFDSTYLRTFFPNDTGAGDLSIGFDTDSSGDVRPTGILTVDRDTHALRRLHLAYPHKPGFRRFSRTFHFFEREGLIFPDTIIETAVIERLLADEDYQLLIILSDYTVEPTRAADRP
jgi:hypothetical protein